MAKMLIGGELVDSVSGQTYEVRNPATGEVVDKVPKGPPRMWSRPSASRRAPLKSGRM